MVAGLAQGRPAARSGLSAVDWAHQAVGRAGGVMASPPHEYLTLVCLGEGLTGLSGTVIATPAPSPGLGGSGAPKGGSPER